ncbi:hypothetical protein P9112_007039 [Eukaryota sp. TZLM1-RC]
MKLQIQGLTEQLTKKDAENQELILQTSRLNHGKKDNVAIDFNSVLPKLLSSSQLSDQRLVFKGKTCNSHRAILSLFSGYFEMCFSQHFVDSEEHEYDLSDDLPVSNEIFETVLNYFPFSINGRLSVEAETFLDDFQKMVQEKTMRRFDIFLWRSRIPFAIINRLPRLFNRIREALARQQADQDFVEEILIQ